LDRAFGTPVGAQRPASASPGTHTPTEQEQEPAYERELEEALARAVAAEALAARKDAQIDRLVHCLCSQNLELVAKFISLPANAQLTTCCVHSMIAELEAATANAVAQQQAMHDDHEAEMQALVTQVPAHTLVRAATPYTPEVSIAASDWRIFFAVFSLNKNANARRSWKLKCETPMPSAGAWRSSSVLHWSRSNPCLLLRRQLMTGGELALKS
jgi:hypothetical protein